MKSKLRTNYKFLYIAQILLMLLVFAMGASLLMPRISVYAEGGDPTYEFDLKVKMLGPDGEDLGLLEVGGGGDYSLKIKVTGTTEDKGFPSGTLTFSYLTELETWEGLNLAGLKGILGDLEMPAHTEIGKSGESGEYDPLILGNFSYNSVDMESWASEGVVFLTALYNEAKTATEDDKDIAYITANYGEVENWIEEAQINITLIAQCNENPIGEPVVSTGALIVSGITEEIGDLLPIIDTYGLFEIAFSLEFEAIIENPATKFLVTGYAFNAWTGILDKDGSLYTTIIISKDMNLENLYEFYLTELESNGDFTLNFIAEFTLIDYDINYNLDDGAYQSGDSNPDKYTVESTGDFNNPVKTGYTFKHWYLLDDETEITVANFEDMIAKIINPENGLVLGEIMLNAKWEAIDYTITYELNGGENHGDNPKNYTIETETITFKDPTKAGYKFDGWYKDANFDESITKIELGTTGNITVYAKWTANKYTVTFAYQGADGGEDTVSIEVTYDSTYGDLPAPTRTGYAFKGWYKEDTYTNKVEAATTVETAEAHTLYAQWTANTYKVAFDKNGGSGESMSNQEFTYDEAKKALSKNTYTKTGYTFIGWNTKIDGVDGASYTDEQSVNNVTTENGATVTLFAQWTANTYTVVFNANGGEGSMSSQPFTYDESQNLTENAFTRTGYTFANWNTQANGNGTSYTDEKSVENLATENGAIVTLYAQWEANYYLVMFKANGGEGAMLNQGFTYDESQNLTENAFTRTGYTFANWNTQVDGQGTSYTDKQSVKNLATENGAIVTLYAQWTAITYTVVFNANGGESSMGSQSFAYDEEKALSENTYTKTGYTFVGWNTEKNGSGESYSDKEEVNNLTTENGATVTLFAQWTANTNTAYTVEYYQQNLAGDAYTLVDTESLTGTTGEEATVTVNEVKYPGFIYQSTGSILSGTIKADGTLVLKVYYDRDSYTITFNTNDGVEIASQTVAFGTTLSLPTPEKNGYTFMDWYTDADLMEKFIATTMPANHVDLFAKWGGEITFKNGGEVVKTVTLATGTEFGTEIPDDPTPVTGYEFDGWYVGDIKIDATYVVGGDIIANATFKAIVYTITYENLEGATNGDNPIDYTIETETFAFKAPTKTGYTFAGWFGEVGLTTQVTGITQGTTEDIIVYAKWTANRFIVVFDANDGTGTMGNQVFKYDETKNLFANEFSKTGYKFNGWNTQADGQGEKTYTDKQPVSNLTSDANAVVTLYAQWTGITYTVKFDANGGSGTMGNQEFTYGVEQALNANTYAKTGYTFAGWKDEQEGTYIDEYSVKNLASEDGATVTLYAQWTANEYEVKFDANGGTGGEMSSQSFTYDADQNLTANAFTRAGYTFAGWTTNKAGGTSYSNGESVKNLTSIANGEVTLYAQWTPITYTVTFNKNDTDATGTMADLEDVVYGETLTIDNKFEKLGYKVTGWALTSDGNVLSEEGLKTLTTNYGTTVTLYAIWEIEIYTITYENVEGATNNNPINYTIETETIIFKAPTKTGYEFDGWYKDDGFGTSFTGITQETTGDITVYAKWTANANTAYTVKYYQQNLADDDYALVEEDTSLTGTTGATATVTGYADKYTGFTYQPTGSVLSGIIAADGSLVLKVYYDRETYTVTFMNEGSIYDTQEIRHGGTVTEPATEPTKDATAQYTYEFAGWDKEVPATITGDITFIAQYTSTAVKYTITFNTNGGDAIAAKEIAFGTELTGDNEIPTPEKDGYTFMGWYTDDGLTVEFTAITMPANHVNLFAKWGGKITFENGGDVVAIETLATGTTLEGIIPTDPIPARGYEFDGWNTETNGSGDAVSSGYIVDGDATIYATFKAIVYTITYENLKGATNNNPDSYTIESAVITFEALTKTGYEFLGWFPDENSSTKVLGIAAGASGDIYVYAKWEVIKYTITFDTNEGEEIDSQEIAFGTELTGDNALPIPERTGYEFVGWYTDEDLTEEFEDETMPVVEQPFTLYADWEAIIYIITFNTNDGDEIDSQEIAFGTELTGDNALPTPEKEGYTFVGWALSSDGDVLSEEELKTLMTSSDKEITLYAIWEVESANTYLYYIIGGGILLILLILGNLLSVRLKNRKK